MFENPATSKIWEEEFMMAIFEMIFCREWYVDRDLPQKSPPTCPTDAAFIARVRQPCKQQAYSITALLCVRLRDLGSKHGATNTERPQTEQNNTEQTNTEQQNTQQTQH